MKVIHEKDYVYAGMNEEWHIFRTNPNKSNFDPEIIFVKRARLVLESGGYQFFDDFSSRTISPKTLKNYLTHVR